MWSQYCASESQYYWFFLHCVAQKFQLILHDFEHKCYFFVVHVISALYFRISFLLNFSSLCRPEFPIVSLCFLERNCRCVFLQQICPRNSNSLFFFIICLRNFYCFFVILSASIFVVAHMFSAMFFTTTFSLLFLHYVSQLFHQSLYDWKYLSFFFVAHIYFVLFFGDFSCLFLCDVNCQLTVYDPKPNFWKIPFRPTTTNANQKT